MKKIRVKLHKNAYKQQQTVQATIDKRLLQSRGRRPQESMSKVTQIPPTIEEPIGQYASMHSKNPIEQIVQRVRNTIDEHDMRELEHVAVAKMVRCVKNREKDLSLLQRPPRGSTSHPSPVVPPSKSASSSPLYEPDGIPEGEQENELEEGEQEDEHEEELENEREGKPENEQAASTGPHDDIADAQKDDESLEILKVVHKLASSKPLTSQRKGKGPTFASVPRRTQLKRTSQS